MKARRILQGIREQRQKELEEYKIDLQSLYDYNEEEWHEGVNIASSKTDGEEGNIFISPIQGIERCLQKRSEILTLDLPFQTDTVSLNKALVDTYAPDKGLRSPKEWLDEEFPDDGTSQGLDFNHQQISLQKIFDLVWPNLPSAVLEESGERVMDWNQKAEVIDFVMEDVQNRMIAKLDEISRKNAKPYKNSSKKVWRSQINRMIRYCRGVNHNLKTPHRGLDSHVLSKYLNHLETRCLKSKNQHHFKQLLEVKLIFYTSLGVSELQNLCKKDFDENKNCLKIGNLQYPIPGTLIRFINSLIPAKDPIFCSDAKTINRFIGQTAKSAGLEGITSTKIRRSLPFICHVEQFFPEKLPRR